MSNTKLGLGEALLRPFTPSRPSSRASQAPIQGQSQLDNITGVGDAILTILETTHWPRKSEEIVKSLIDVIKQLPTRNPRNPSNDDTTHEPAPGNAEPILSALQDVRTKLDAAASRHGASTKSSAFFHRSETCNQVLNTCREQMTGALAALRSTPSDTQVKGKYGADTAIKFIFSNELIAGTAPPDKPQDHQTLPAGEKEASRNDPKDRPNATNTSNEQLVKTAAAPNEESVAKSDAGTDSARRKERLDWANKAFKGVEMISGSIPIIGSYVGAAAKVGVACVELAQLADKNEEEANVLESRTTRLSEILGHFEGGSANDDHIGTSKLVQELQKELQAIQDEIKVLNSSPTFRKMWSSSDHADSLKEFQEKIRVALEELQLLVNLRTSDLIAEISSRQLREENDRLLNLLGDANYGAQGHEIEDVICLPGTRVAILERIENWIRGGRESKQVLWILGMAGRGKSTLASTVAYKWQNRASCAIFHFRRGQTELQKRLICALARQLGACTASPVKHAILESIRENKDIAQGRLETQFQFLVDALRALQHPTPILLIVDALDECEDVSYALSFVRHIRRHAGLLPPEVKILLTCRPEAPLILALKRSEWEEESLDLETNMDESEIRLFLEHELSRIREDHDLPGGWPSRESVQALVERSQRLFQWARTAVRYIADGSPGYRLDELLHQEKVFGLTCLRVLRIAQSRRALRRGVSRRSGAMYAELTHFPDVALPSINDGLDGLYKPILSKAYEKVKKSRAKTLRLRRPSQPS
ncbi:hypothetical protein FRC00_011273 [Tulasnella sp. 408]|nr:hypothetical protein FRC00_011273 [Tulasnella sp. 408]